MPFRLELMYRGQVVEVYELTKPEYTIGRDDVRDIVIRHPSVSRQHARLARSGATYTIEDTDSINHVYVNGVRIVRPVHLKQHDRIDICEHTLLVRSEDHLGTVEMDDTDSTIVASLDAMGAASAGDRARAADRLQAMLRILQAMGHHLELRQLLAKTLDGLLEIFPQAERGLVLLDVQGKLVPSSMKSRSPDTDDCYTYSRTVVRQAMDQGHAVLSEDLSDDSRFVPSESISWTKLRSVMCVPLFSADSRPIGVLQLDTRSGRGAFRVEDLEILATVAGQVASAIEYTRLHHELLSLHTIRQEMEFAKEMQRAFIPRQEPNLEGYEFASYYQPARYVGGDFYQFYPLSDERLAVLLGDVAGKGVPAALLMSKASAICRANLVSDGLDMSSALAKVNEEVFETGLDSAFVTLALCVLCPHRHRVDMASAGHMSPLVLRADGSLEEPVQNDVRGLPLGMFAGQSYGMIQIALEPGDAVVLYSDGILDACNAADQPYARARLLQDLTALQGKTAIQLRDGIMAAVESHLGDHPQDDDISFVAFRRCR